MRKFNFCAGPAAMPLEVLKKAQSEFLDWNEMGASVMELSHRGKAFVALIESCESDLRALLDIPTNYQVLFLQGGAYSQFDFIPMNLLGDKSGVDYIDTGIWSAKALEVAKKYAKVNVIYSDKTSGYRSAPAPEELFVNKESAYLHFCSNETINGVEFSYDIGHSPIPVVADMSSNLLSRVIDVSKYGLIYAGAQKNIGPAGLTIVIVRDDLLEYASTKIPDVFNYKIQAKNCSMLNTPPTFSIYLMALIFKNLMAKGGVREIEKINDKKAMTLYNAIDDSELYSNNIDIGSRSRMNVPFILKDRSLDKLFLEEANKAHLINLNGHRSIGGMRASIYNAMPMEGILALTEFMHLFESKYYS